MKPHEQAVFRFGEFVLVPSERLLLRDGKPLALTGKAFDLLATLVRHAGHLLTKDELLRAVWPGVVVEEVNLSVNVSALRKVLGAAPGAVDWIETVPRQGYRFNAAVEVGDIATTQLTPPQELAISREVEGASRITGMPPRLSRRKIAWLLGGLSATAVAVVAGARWLRGRATYPSVAVLPFTVDGAPNAYLADGLVEGMINGLTRLRALRVTPRASAFRFRDAIGDPIAAGRALDVAAVVTGSLSRSGDGVRLQVDLVDVARNAQVWSTTYQVAAADLPQLEIRVMHDLAGAMHVQVAGAERAGLAIQPTPHPQAYQAYLQGRYLWNQRSETSLQGAIVQFRRAVDLDPRFTLAYAGLADAHTTLGYLGYLAPVSTFPIARPYALKALELDPSLAQAHASLAYIRFYFDWDWEGARQEFSRAIELNPNDPVSHQWYAVYLLASGHPDRAFGEVQLAHRLDPLSLAINTDIGFHHYYNGRYGEAVSQLQSVLDMKSDFLLAHLWLARALLEMRRFDAALAETAVAEDKARDWLVLVAARGFTYAMAGMTSEAQAVLREMDTLATQRFVTSYGIALVHAGLGHKDEAFGWLDRAFEERSHWLVWLRLDPRWKNLRDDPRFATLIERIKYPA
ncbi:MAG: tetratricopeptide repeat protein [Variovorax sp.]|nr:MAG: tetratricopeptide repeat protein [Variovorax sp.]